MATLDDKILGEKTQNYCSSSEDEHEDDENGEKESTKSSSSKGPVVTPGNPPVVTRGYANGRKWEGYSVNTGPKGVLKDWQIFQEQQEKIRLEKEQDLLKKIAQTSMTCASEQENTNAVTDEDLMSDSIVEEFLRKRMDEMMKNHTSKVEVGKVHEITSGDEFLKFVDETNPKIPVVVHIYESGTSECVKMNECIASLSTVYLNTKFCKIRGSVAGVSQHFRREGVPALLVYKGGNLIGNFARLKDEFGTDFYEGDVENFLIENGMLEDRNNIPRLFKPK